MDSSVELGRRAAKRAESRLLIDGHLIPPASGAEFDNHSPATGLLLGTVAAAGAEDMDRAIGAARRAFDHSDWPTNRARAQGADAPFGGYKNSGVGRQCGLEGFGQYLEIKTIGCRVPRQV